MSVPSSMTFRPASGPGTHSSRRLLLGYCTGYRADGTSPARHASAPLCGPLRTAATQAQRQAPPRHRAPGASATIIRTIPMAELLAVEVGADRARRPRAAARAAGRSRVKTDAAALRRYTTQPARDVDRPRRVPACSSRAQRPRRSAFLRARLAGAVRGSEAHRARCRSRSTSCRASTWSLISAQPLRPPRRWTTVKRLAAAADGSPLFLVPPGTARRGSRSRASRASRSTTGGSAREVGACASRSFRCSIGTSARCADTNQTLWGGWVIERRRPQAHAYRRPGLLAGRADIGERLGPFDIGVHTRSAPTRRAGS